jgi:hypothetical protein
MRSLLILLLLSSAVLLAPNAAHAANQDEIRFPGCDFLAAGIGPVIGWSLGKGTENYHLFGGFELTGGCPWLRLSTGATYRRAPAGKAREQLYWAAWDPGLGAGGTVGIGHSSELGISPILGAWLGAASPVTDELYQRGGSGGGGAIMDVCVSLSLGVRVRFAGKVTRTDLYIAPKVQYCAYPQFNS